MTGTLTIRRSRGKTTLLILGCLAFVAVGVLMINEVFDDSSRRSPELVHLIGWVSILFFGACGLLAVASLIKPAEVTLTSKGFQVTDLRTKPVVRWSDVDRFFIVQVRSSKIVAYDLKAEAKSALKRLSMSYGPAWGDGTIPAHLEKGPEPMLTLLEDWRRHHLNG